LPRSLDQRDHDQGAVNAYRQDLIPPVQCLRQPAEMLIDLLLDCGIDAGVGGQIGDTAA
jgi:hypothetical protein